MSRRVVALLLVLAAVPAAAASAAVGPGDWAQPGAVAAGTRFQPVTPITRTTVGGLRVRWRFRIPGPWTESGWMTATPLVVGRTVYLQDMQSGVWALAAGNGRVRWHHRFGATSPGPNGVAYVGGSLFGATDTTAFALSAATGRLLWQRRLATDQEQFVDVAPAVANGLVYLGTVGFVPNGIGAVYGLDVRTGAVRWRRSTILRPWPHPAESGGGGIWQPPSVASDGTVYAGTANPNPWGGTPQRPNGGSFPGPVLWTDSLLALGGRSGRLLWWDQVTPHDIRDHDFQNTPVVARAGGRDVVIGGGKSGIVISWDRRTHRRLWQRRVGVHRNDSGPLPRHKVPVCPGLLGGIETPMALGEGRVYVPVVNLCSLGSATGYAPYSTVNPLRGTGELLALDAARGRVLWRRVLSQPLFACATAAPGLVFTATFDGRVLGLDAASGRTLWEARTPAGVNACPSLGAGLLVVPAGVPLRKGQRPTVVAYG